QTTMIKQCFLIIVLFLAELSFSQHTNFIIQVNDQLLGAGEVTNLYIKFASDNKKYYVNYYPGDLILDETIMTKIDSSDAKFHLHFDRSTFNHDKQDIANYNIELNNSILKQPYVIANVFDFNSRKYKRWYQFHPKANYLVQLTYPGSGLYIRRK